MKIALPTVGPIVGYTAPDQSRIFIRGEVALDAVGQRRCFGALRYRKQGSRKWSRVRVNKLEAHFDGTCVFVLEGLQADTAYDYQAGWFFAESELDAVQNLPDGAFEWNNAAWAFRTSTADPAHPRAYVVGSCRYLLRLFGGAVFDERGDKCFQTVNRQIDDGQPVDALVMVGDQIYADDLNFFNPDTAIDEFLRRYRTVFSQPGIRDLMARTPTYMILDDHEIEDNWPGQAARRDRVTLYPHAIHAYQIYQCSHSPVFAALEGRLVGTLTRFWYSFTDGCADWFVLDSRTERHLGPGPRRMIKDSQMAALKAWLTAGKEAGRVRFIVSSVPFIPDFLSDSGDKWAAFPEQRNEIIAFIRAERIRNVVFVSGDVHCSFTCRMTSAADPDFAIHQIVSSALFWPYPHTGQYELQVPAQIMAGEEVYDIELTSEVHSDDNFARIEAAPREVKVSFYERKGELLGKGKAIRLA